MIQVLVSTTTMNINRITGFVPEALAAYQLDGGEKNIILNYVRDVTQFHSFCDAEELIMQLYGIFKCTPDTIRPVSLATNLCEYTLDFAYVLSKLSRLLSAVEYYEKKDEKNDGSKLRIVLVCSYIQTLYWDTEDYGVYIIKDDVIERMLKNVHMSTEIQQSSLIKNTLRHLLHSGCTNKSRTVNLLQNLKPLHCCLKQYLENIDNGYYHHKITQMLCDIFPITYAQKQFKYYQGHHSFKAMEDSPHQEVVILHELAHTRRRQDFLNEILTPLSNKRFYVVKNNLEIGILHLLHDEPSFIPALRIGYAHHKYQQKHILIKLDTLFLFPEMQSLVIQSLWFHLAKPTSYFYTLCLEYYFPTMDKLDTVVCRDRINTDLIGFHQRVVNHIHILYLECNIIPEMIIDILKNIYLSHIHLSTHAEDTKYLYELVMQECKSTTNSFKTIKGVVPEVIQLRGMKRKKIEE